MGSKCSGKDVKIAHDGSHGISFVVKEATLAYGTFSGLLRIVEQR